MDRGFWFGSFAALVCSGAIACGGNEPPTEIRNVARIGFAQVGTGAYVGGGRVLTNWHMCVNQAEVKELEAEGLESLEPRLYDAPSDGSPAYAEGTAVTDRVCQAKDGNPAYVTAEDNEECLTMSSVRIFFMNFMQAEVDVSNFQSKRVVYANRDLDLCIIEVGDEVRERLDAQLGPLTIDTHAPAFGQRVVMAGHPHGQFELAWEECNVISSAVSPVLDPDTLNPSTLVVPSIKIDCVTAAPGSSGSPIFDADTGYLLGLLWTGATKSGDTYSNYALGSSTNAWAVQLKETGAKTKHSRLDELLGEFAAQP